MALQTRTHSKYNYTQSRKNLQGIPYFYVVLVRIVIRKYFCT